MRVVRSSECGWTDHLQRASTWPQQPAVKLMMRIGALGTRRRRVAKALGRPGARILGRQDLTLDANVTSIRARALFQYSAGRRGPRGAPTRAIYGAPRVPPTDISTNA